MTNLKIIFKKIEIISPSNALEERIFREIRFKGKKQIKRDLMFYRVWTFGSLALAIYAIFVFGGSILNSEFWSMTSLFFSDIKIVTANWSDYAFSIMETLPVINLILILIPIFVFAISIDFYRNLKDRIKYNHYNFA
jgi:hypothetical protein